MEPYYKRIDKLISVTLAKKDGRANVRLQKYLLKDFEYYSLLTKVIFMFKYADYEENRTRGRANRPAGFREGTRNFSYIPANKIPRKRKRPDHLIRYYDIGRSNWRSFRKSNYLVISAFWSASAGKYVDTPEEAGFGDYPGGIFNPNKNATPAPKSDGSRERRTAEKEAKKRAKEIERKAQKDRENNARRERKIKRIVNRVR